MKLPPRIAGRLLALTIMSIAVLASAGEAEEPTGEAVELLQLCEEEVEVRVGPDEQFETLEAALDWSSRFAYVNGGALKIQLTPGEHILDCYDYRNVYARNVYINGPALDGDMPVASDMSGDKAADLEFIKSKFKAWIVIRGDKKYGLSLPYGIGAIQNLAIINPDTYGDGPTRYTVGCGLLNSWENSESSTSIRLGKVAVVGGVWGVNAVDCRVVNRNQLFFAYQFNGGPMHLSSNSQYRGFSPHHDYQAFVPNAQYGMICHDSSAWMDNACTIRGAQIAFLANGGGARIDASGAVVAECEVVASGQSGGVINIPFHTATDCDASPGHATVELWKGFAFGRRALYFAGLGSQVNIYKATIKGAKGTFGFYAVAGGQIFGTGVTLDDYFFESAPAGALGYADSGSQLILGVTATNPRADSSTRLTADNGGRIYAQGSEGVTYEPDESGQMNAEGSLVVQ